MDNSFDSFADLASRNADPSNWMWSNRRRSKFEDAPGPWRTIYETWYGKEDKSTSPLLSLDRDVLSADALSSIYIRKSYLEMFETVWTQARTEEGEGGVIISGQPGIGKTLFLYYLLVRLLQLKQVVLFSPAGTIIYVFYHDGVYQLNGDKDDEFALPQPTEASDAFIWSLFDIAAQEEPPRIVVRRPCFPVQTTSPSPTRYKLWSKTNFPLRAGLPLWTLDELAQGLKCQKKYPRLIKALQTFHSSNSGDPLAPFPGANTLLAQGFAEADGKPTPEDAVKFLLDEAIDRFGYSARDVFHAVFHYIRTTEQHLSAFNQVQNIDHLQYLSTLAVDHDLSDPISDRILAVSPVYRGPYRDVRWTVDFKSDWVGKNIIGRLTDVEKREIARIITHFQSMPETQGLARCFFEPVAHRQIAGTVAAPGDS